MFEQELYNAEPVEKPKEGDLFYDYERKNWDLGPRIYKMLALSAILNLSVLAFIAQSDVLTRKGCDSPWVGRVCQVLDMAYVGAMLYGTERDFVDAEYDNIDLGDSEITFIDVSNMEPLFRYPADYDQYANPEKLLAQQQAADQPLPAGFNNPLPTYPSPSSSGSDLLSRRQELPKPSNNADDLPDSPFSTNDGVGGASRSRKGRGGKLGGNRPDANSNTDQTVALGNTNSNTNTNEATPPASDQVLAVEINKRPMVDLGNTINQLREKGPLNLESEFSISGKGKIDQSGRLDQKTFKYGPTTSTDPAVVDVIKESIEALNEAGYFAYIKNAVDKDVKFVDLNFVLTQGPENVEATIETPLANESVAKLRESSFDFFIGLAKKAREGQNATQNDKDDLTLLEGIQTEASGKILRIKFVIPKGLVHPMIQRKLAEQAAELKKPSGQAASKTNETSALK